ncbi:response regulator transcription factor [Bacillus sp. 28A-2]|uniref:response regulator transcription factor n=1 Tax=Bacillus sp. 28A-2 TaxID=2772252 RepID=UPI00168D4FCC|nr:response regulator transcription factor [Bacillus sp. 28A-2]MBD3859433.1 response regulator transcription factor [Bacillus sp. 28A-2]
METAKILIADDEEAIVKMVERVLKKEGFQHIYKAYHADEALDVVKNEDIHLLLLDVMMPGKSGFDVLPEMRKYTKAPIFYLTARTSDVDKLTGFAQGADDYITKPFNPLELVARIKAHLNRTYISLQEEQEEAQRQYEYAHFSYHPHAAELKVRGEVTACSAQLLSLLKYFCDHPNVVLSKDQIYEKVWGVPSYGDNNTVMVHIRKLREKIELDPSQPEYIVTIRGMGYKFIPHPVKVHS